MQKLLWPLLAILISIPLSSISAQDFITQQDFYVKGVMGLDAFIALADAHLKGVVHSIQVLAMTEEVRSGDWEKMHPLLKKYSEFEIISGVWFAELSGDYFFVGKGKQPHSLNDRSYFNKAKNGEIVMGDLVLARESGKKVMIAAVPIMHYENMIGVLGASVSLDKLSMRIADDLHLPNNMVFFALNDEGRAAIHSKPKYLFESPDQMRSMTLKAAAKSILSEEEGYVEYIFENKAKKLIFRKSTVTNWHYAFGIEREIKD